jgi:hypothetical protein
MVNTSLLKDLLIFRLSINRHSIAEKQAIYPISLFYFRYPCNIQGYFYPDL